VFRAQGLKKKRKKKERRKEGGDHRRFEKKRKLNLQRPWKSASRGPADQKEHFDKSEDEKKSKKGKVGIFTIKQNPDVNSEKIKRDKRKRMGRGGKRHSELRGERTRGEDTTLRTKKACGPGRGKLENRYTESETNWEPRKKNRETIGEKTTNCANGDTKRKKRGGKTFGFDTQTFGDRQKDELGDGGEETQAQKEKKPKTGKVCLPEDKEMQV